MTDRQSTTASGMESPPCPVGCVSTSTETLTGPDRLHGLPGTFRVVRCEECGLQRTSPRPDRSTIGHYYPAGYGPHVDATPDHAGRRSSRLMRIAMRLLDTGGTRTPSMSPGRLLEIGAGRGDFAVEMRSHGWVVAGQEVSSSALDSMGRRDIERFGVPIGDVPVASGPFDLIAGFMVLEHLHDPVGDLRHLRDLSHRGTHLVLSTPNCRSLDFRIFRNRWYGLQLPTHLFHFEPETITTVLEAAGWRVTKVIHQRTVSDTLASLAYVAEDMGLPDRVVRSLASYPTSRPSRRYLLWPLGLALSWLRLSSRMTVWATQT